MPRLEEGGSLLPPIVSLVEIVIDGVPLSERLGIHRASLSFVASVMESSNLDALQWFVNVLLGKEPPWNQFLTNRAVLFGCHCGVDYCGVVSCEIEVSDNHVVWRQIGYEDDDGVGQLYTVIPELRFLREPYEKNVEQLFVLHGLSGYSE